MAVLGRGARPPFLRSSRSRPDRPRSGRVRRRAGRDRPRLLGLRTGHRHGRRRGRRDERLFHLSWTAGSGRRRLHAPSGRTGRRLSAKTDGGLRQRPAARRPHDPHSQGSGRRQPTRRRRLLRRSAHFAARERLPFRRRVPDDLADRRPLARDHGLRILSRPQRPGRRRRPASRRGPANRLYAGADRPLEVGQAPQRSSRRHGRRCPEADGRRSARHSPVAVRPTRFSRARQRRCHRVRFGRSCGATGSIA